MDTPRFTNDLIQESSPYLLQHAHNPVNWKPYSPKVFDLAEKENKLLVISIGYSSCHWCHVMERESFEDESVAAVMNSDFISVKIDREERPDIDQIYIQAVQLMTGSAGWPLHVVTLPDGRPVWGGTYFKKEEWIHILEQLRDLYKSDPEKMFSYAALLEKGIKKVSLITPESAKPDLEKIKVESCIEKIKEKLDHQSGGFKGSPKFMMPGNLDFLLQFASFKKDPEILEFLKLTLKKMAYGGLYDQIGGGFSRYSTDSEWHIPHFEKMLYDNALAVSLYCHAYQFFKKPYFKEIISETLSFIRKEFTSETGAFYSSLDADSINNKGNWEEGAFYVYTLEELEQVVQSDFSLFKSYYNINSKALWKEDQYVLIRTKKDEEIAEDFNLSVPVLKQKIKSWKQNLSDFRNQRKKPRLDDKILTSWNAMMLTAYVDAYMALGEKKFLNTARKNAEFILEKMMTSDFHLFRTHKNGKSRIPGFLKDYAFTIEAFIKLYEADLNEKWLQISKKLTEVAIRHFFDPDSGMFVFVSKKEPVLISPSIDYIDNVMPSPNSVMAKNLFLLSRHFQNPDYEAKAVSMLQAVVKEAQKYPSGFAGWLSLLLNLQNDFYEIAILGPEAAGFSQQLNRHYIPGKLTAGSISESELPLLKNRFRAGKTFIYVCVNNSCQQPVADIEFVIKNLKTKDFKHGTN